MCAHRIAVDMWTTQARYPHAHSDNKAADRRFKIGPKSPTRLHDEAQKKACRRQSASEPRWLARVNAGSASKAGLTLPASYLSMRQQSPPTWCALTVGARAESAWWRTRPWGTGRQ